MAQTIDENEQDEIETIAAKILQRRCQRVRLQSILSKIAEEVTVALETASLKFTIFLMIPKSGHSILTFITPSDPPDTDWNTACRLVCRIVEQKLGLKNLIASEVEYVAAGMQIETTPADEGPLAETTSNRAALPC